MIKKISHDTDLSEQFPQNKGSQQIKIIFVQSIPFYQANNNQQKIHLKATEPKLNIKNPKNIINYKLFHDLLQIIALQNKTNSYITHITIIQKKMNSKPNKIFGFSRGIDISQPPQGRNVQPMLLNKKIQLSSQKHIQSPFDGYINTSNSTNDSLSISQVKEYNHLQLIKILVRQQLAKINVSNLSTIRNQVDIMKTEIRSLKENIIVIKNINQSNYHQKQNNEEIKKQLEIKFENDKNQIFKNLKQFIKIMDQSIKQYCKNTFLSRQFINDFNQLLGTIQDRIKFLQQDKYSHKKQQQPIIIAQALDLRVKKVQRQFQNNKKIIIDIHPQITQLNNICTSLKTIHHDDEQRTNNHLQQLKNNNNQIHKQLHTIHQSINQLQIQNKQHSKKLSILQQIQSSSPPPKWVFQQGSNQSSTTKQFINTEKQLSGGILQKMGRQVPQQTVNQKLFFSPPKQQNSKDINTKQIQTVKNTQQKQQQIPHFYQIDKNNSLLDQHGNYILNQKGKQVQLSDDQLTILRKSTIVKLCQ